MYLPDIPEETISSRTNLYSVEIASASKFFQLVFWVWSFGFYSFRWDKIHLMLFLILWSTKQTWILGKKNRGPVLLEGKKEGKCFWKTSTVAIWIISSPAHDHHFLQRLTHEPKRKYTLEQEFVLVMLKLRMGLLIYDLASWIHVSGRNVFHVFSKLVKMLAKYLAIIETSHCNFTWLFLKVVPKSYSKEEPTYLWSNTLYCSAIAAKGSQMLSQA